jgi:hypothetical protein
MTDETAKRIRQWAEKALLGYAPERTDSGARIHVNSSGTTSVDPSALSEIARRRFREMRPATGRQVKQPG